MRTSGASISAWVLLKTFASRRDRKKKWLRVWVWLRGRGRWFSKRTFRPLPPCFHVHPWMLPEPAKTASLRRTFVMPSGWPTLSRALPRLENFQNYAPGRSQKFIFPNYFAVGVKHGSGLLRCTHARLWLSLLNSVYSQERCVEDFWPGWRSHSVCRGRACGGLSGSSPAGLSQQSLSWSSN